MKKSLVLVLATIMVTTILVGALPSTVDSKVITTLGNPGNPLENTVTLDGSVPPLLDATTYIDIPYGENNVLPDSSFTISPVDTGDGKFAYNPAVDVGVDGDVEWTYDGTGYGHFGYQSVFSDDYKKKTLKYNSPGVNTDTTVLLPKKAEVVDARINIEGRLSEPTFKGTTLELDTGLDHAYYLDVGDIDDDGSDDVVVSSKNSVSGKADLVWYKNPSPPGNTDWKKNVITSNLNYAHRVKVTDLDLDGDLDVIVTTYSSSVSNTGIWWYENKDLTGLGTGNGSQWEGGNSAHRIDYGKTVSYPAHLAVGDLDNDGDMDIATASLQWSTYNIFIFENQDPDNGTKWNRVVAHTDSASWGQINGLAIGKISHKTSHPPDIAFSVYSWPGKVGWLENDKTPFSGNKWTAHYFQATNDYYPNWVAIGDINNDNRNDVVLAKYYSYGIYWYKNPADPRNASSWTRDQIYSNTYYPSDLVLAKVNSDSDLDIVTTSSSLSSWNPAHKIHYLENNNNGNSWTHSLIDGSLTGVMGVAVGNMDKASGDADLDILGAGSDAGEIKWYSNGGGASPSWSTKMVDNAGIANPNDVEVMDVDADGDNDIIVAGAKSGDIQWFETPDNPFATAWNIYSIDPSLGQAWHIATGDIDGDGDIDIAATSHIRRWWGSSNYGEVVWYEHPGTSVKTSGSWTKHVVDNQANSPYGVDVFDYDGDGDGDIVAAIEYDNKVRLYDNTNSVGTSWNFFEIGTGISNYPTAVKVGDIDSDSDLDVGVAVGYDWSWGSNGVLWLENPSNKATVKWPKHTIDKAIKSVKDLEIVDVDDNGYPDVVVTTRSEFGKGVYWYANPVQSGKEWTQYKIAESSRLPRDGFGGSFISVDDIGNDGYLDVIVGSGWSTSQWDDHGEQELYWYEEPDEPLAAESWVRYKVMDDIQEPRGVFIADMDGAGLKDIVCVGSSFNEIWWHRVNMSYPRDVTLNVQAKGGVDFEYQGEVNVPKTSPNLALQFKEVLEDAGTTWEKDIYGNELSEIYFEVKSPVVGRVGIHTVDIIYMYDAKVEINPHNTYLFNELNEIIPDEGDGTMSVNIGVTSMTPATMKIGNVQINYNSPPTLEKDIPSDRHVNEGESVNALLNLHNYFSDDIDQPEDLIYRVEENSEYDNVWVFITDGKFLKVSATRDSDWSGTLDVVVSAQDTMGATTLSNKFSITIDNTNDPPDTGKPVPDFEIYEGQSTFLLNMDDDNYFTDIDSEKLYYRAVVDESYQNYLRIDFDEQNNMYATALGDRHDSNIPVHIYCDDKDMTGLSIEELETGEVVQDIFIDIINVNDGPQWLNFPTVIEIDEDYSITNGKPYKWLNLNDFAYDIDNKEFELSYSVIKNTNSSYFRINIDSQDWLFIDNSLVENYVGQTFVIIRMTDGVMYSDIAFWVKTIPINDKPTIQLSSPENHAKVSGEVRIQGIAADIEGLEKVVVRINDGQWMKITGTNTWEFVWDTSELDDAEYLLSFRAIDNDKQNQKVSDVVQIRLNVLNVDSDPDNDGYYGDDDKFPNEPSQWNDTDRDGYGDNSFGYNADLFPEDPTEWYDFDRDGYGNNIDEFEYDPTQWNDTDGDGFGDNLWGNNPDKNIMDSNTGGEEISDEKGESENGYVIGLWIAAVIVGIMIILLTFLFNRFYKPPEEDQV